MVEAIQKHRPKHTKLNLETVVQIRMMYANGYSQGKLSTLFPVSVIQIGRIVRGEVWKDAPTEVLNAEEVRTGAAELAAEIANDPYWWKKRVGEAKPVAPNYTVEPPAPRGELDKPATSVIQEKAKGKQDYLNEIAEMTGVTIKSDISAVDFSPIYRLYARVMGARAVGDSKARALQAELSLAVLPFQASGGDGETPLTRPAP